MVQKRYGKVEFANVKFCDGIVKYIHVMARLGPVLRCNGAVKSRVVQFRLVKVW